MAVIERWRPCFWKVFFALYHLIGMKTKLLYMGLLVGAPMLLNSCFVTTGPYGDVQEVAVSTSYSGTAGWVAASYDVTGFPIYGYYNGRPVYGYNPHGDPIFSFGALTATCLVPSWGPAGWYVGSWHYPRHVRRVYRPSHHPHDHHPGRHHRGRHH